MGVEYRLSDGLELVECGGCGEILETTATEDEIPEAPEPIDMIQVEADRLAVVESARAKLAVLGLTEEEVLALIG